MLSVMEGDLTENDPGELRRETAEAKAERIIAEKLAALGWSGLELAARSKGDPEKLALAAALRKETTLPLKRIAERVGLGSSKSANTRLHKWMKQTQSANPNQPSLGL